MICKKMPKSFIQSGNCRPSSSKPLVRIILPDIMDCYVKLVRLSDREIEQATAKNICDSNHNRRESRASHELDHSYSVLSLPEDSSDTDDFDSVCSQPEDIQPDLGRETNTDDSASACLQSEQNSPDSSPETKESNGDYAANGSLSLASPNFSWTESDESEDDDRSPITFPPIHFDSDEDMASPQSNVDSSNGVVITNDSTNTSNSPMELTHTNGSSHPNGMIADLNSNGLPVQRMDDDDEDLRFLYGLQEELEQTANQNGTTGNCDENGNVWPSIRIFGNVCMKYLTDVCFNPYCEHQHVLPSIDAVQAKLNGASSREILELQNHVLLRYDKLMAAFFETFCMHCGRKWKNHRENLRTMIGPLSKRPLAATYLKQIVNGFLSSGMKFNTCINQLMLEMDSSLTMDDRFNILWALMIDPRNDKCLDHLKLFQPVFVGNALGVVGAIDKLMKYHVMGELDELRNFTVNLVKKCRIDTLRSLDSELLLNFIGYVRTFDPISKATIEQKAKQFNFKTNDMN